MPCASFWPSTGEKGGKVEKIREEQPRIYAFLERVVEHGRLAHAYLFSGPEGTGKREMALFLAQRLLCSGEEKPCGQCPNCLRIKHDNHPDVRWLKPEGQSIKIDQVRQIQSHFARRSLDESWRVLVIDGADQLTSQGANSLLKFVEEPEAKTVIVFLASFREKVLPTIRSRCQEIVFPPPPPWKIYRQLAEEYGEEKARVVAQLTADLEEGRALCEAEWFAELETVVLQLIEECMRNGVEAFMLVEHRWLKVVKEREETGVGLDLALLWYRDLLYVKLGMDDRLTFLAHKDKLVRQARKVREAQLVHWIKDILTAKKKLSAFVHPQLVLEQLVLRLKEDVHV